MYILDYFSEVSFLLIGFNIIYGIDYKSLFGNKYKFLEQSIAPKLVQCVLLRSEHLILWRTNGNFVWQCGAAQSLGNFARKNVTAMNECYGTQRTFPCADKFSIAIALLIVHAYNAETKHPWDSPLVFCQKSRYIIICRMWPGNFLPAFRKKPWSGPQWIAIHLQST